MKRLALALCLLSAPGWGDEVHFSTFPPGYVYQLAPESPNGRDLLGSTRKASVVQRRDGVDDLLVLAVPQPVPQALDPQRVEVIVSVAQGVRIDALRIAVSDVGGLGHWSVPQALSRV